jgi:hypothetical protein
VHNKPQHYVFLYPFNDSIKGDANVNIEGIRRTLASLYSDTAMPRTLYVQADNASDNKNWTLMLFFAMLVYHGYTTQVFFSFLMVGHTVCNAATSAAYLPHICVADCMMSVAPCMIDSPH